MYPIDKNDKVKWACIDIDKNPEPLAKQIFDFIKAKKIAKGISLEFSGRGYHVWIFFKNKIPAGAGRRFAIEIVRRSGIENSETPEIFPKQDSIKGGYGNLVKLPFGYNRKRKKWSVLIYPSSLYDIEPIEIPPDVLHELILLDKSENFEVKSKIQERYWWNKCPVIKMIREHGVPEGHRDEAAFLLARVYWEMGLTSEEAYILLKHWDETKNTPPLGSNVIKTKVKQAYKGKYSVGFRSIIKNSILNQYCPPDCNICYYKKKDFADKILELAKSKKLEGVYTVE